MVNINCLLSNKFLKSIGPYKFLREKAKKIESRESLFEVTKGLETLKVEGKNTKDSMESYVKNINSLQNILQNPKHRGNLGEFLLEKTLSDFLAPKQYKLQYQLEGGVVDAVINVENNTLIPIDAK